jgi:Domain of unknown function (DUF4424)
MARLHRVCTQIALALFALLAPAPALANDSEAEVGIGGIVLKAGSAIIMASEDLFISEQVVRVKYRFENPTARDIRATVAFPLPGQPRAVIWEWQQEPGKRDWSGFEYSTRVDGQLMRFRAIELAVIAGRDVTAAVKASGLPMDWYVTDGFGNEVAALPPARRAALTKQGLLVRDPQFEGKLVPAWDVATWFVREQVFPAGKAITVEHEYKPQVGGSVGGALYAGVRRDNPEYLADYRRRFCLDDAFLGGIDRRLAVPKTGPVTHYGETWVSYVLSPGANWNGPIRDFRLVVDKGAPENLVSFCMDGVTKISPTRFEVRKRDFVPTRDLSILIAKFYKMEE